MHSSGMLWNIDKILQWEDVLATKKVILIFIYYYLLLFYFLFMQK